MAPGEARERLADALLAPRDGGLEAALADPSATSVDLRAHLAACAPCSRELDALRALGALLATAAPHPRAAPSPSPPPTRPPPGGRRRPPSARDGACFPWWRRWRPWSCWWPAWPAGWPSSTSDRRPTGRAPHPGSSWARRRGCPA